MTPQVDARLSDLLDPLRDVAVGELLQGLAEELEKGAEVVPEPVLRDAAGRVVRDGALSLPRRGDIAVTKGGRTLVRRIESPEPRRFEPLCLVSEAGFTTVVSPFRWEAAEMVVETHQERPDWTPLRHWFLEWFQPRFGELAPDLDGAVHGLTGPQAGPEGIRLTLDFGSAPLGAFAAMLQAMEETGALRVRIGHEV